MFRIECFVDDKRLAQVLRSLAGVAIGDPKIQPVVNGEAKDDTVVAKNSGALIDLWRDFAKENKLTGGVKFKADQIKAFTVHIGRSEASYGHFRDRLMEAGVLRKAAGGKGSSQEYAAVLK